VVLAVFAADVAPDDEGGNGPRAGAFERCGGALGIGTRRPGVVDQQYRAAGQVRDRLVLVGAEAVGFGWRPGAPQRAEVARADGLDELGDVVQRMYVVAEMPTRGDGRHGVEAVHPG